VRRKGNEGLKLTCAEASSGVPESKRTGRGERGRSRTRAGYAGVIKGLERGDRGFHGERPVKKMLWGIARVRKTDGPWACGVGKQVF